MRASVNGHAEYLKLVIGAGADLGLQLELDNDDVFESMSAIVSVHATCAPLHLTIQVFMLHTSSLN